MILNAACNFRIKTNEKVSTGGKTNFNFCLVSVGTMHVKQTHFKILSTNTQRKM